jgi:hypothetical protein
MSYEHVSAKVQDQTYRLHCSHVLPYGLLFSRIPDVRVPVFKPKIRGTQSRPIVSRTRHLYLVRLSRDSAPKIFLNSAADLPDGIVCFKPLRRARLQTFDEGFFCHMLGTDRGTGVEGLERLC